MILIRLSPARYVDDIAFPKNSTLTRALEEAYKVGQKPVGADMIDDVLAKDINGLEPRLTREGYLAELLNAKPREIKEFLRGQLAPGRTSQEDPSTL